MTSDIEIRRAAEGCALQAYPRWKRLGVRIANHSFDIDNQHYEWLTIIGREGRMKIWQHHPAPKAIGQFTADDLERLNRPLQGGYRTAEIRGHIHRETRRKR